MWEYLIVVNAFSLRVAFCYQFDFVAYNITIWRSLFLRKFHLQLITFFPLDNSDSSQVSFLCKKLIFFIIASFHILNFELISASLYVDGIASLMTGET